MDAAPTCGRRVYVFITRCFRLKSMIYGFIRFNLAGIGRFVIVFQFNESYAYFIALFGAASAVRRTLYSQSDPVTCADFFIALMQDPISYRVEDCVQ